MDIEKLLGYVNDIERYANDLRTVSIGYSMSLKNVAEGIREIIETYDESK